jgi:prefoldin subunit 5
MALLWAGAFGGANAMFLSAVEDIEGKLQRLQGSVGELSNRLETVERALAAKSRTYQQKVKSAEVRKKRRKRD